MNIAEGALGCATWDGGVVLARWIASHGPIFEGKRVLELGAGVGIGGIVAGRFAAHTAITDYLPKVNENAAYNVKVNLSEDGHDERVSVGYLDWFQSLPDYKPPEDQHLCTRRKHGTAFVVQPWYRCPQCFGVDPSAGCCEDCYTGYHSKHDGSSLAETSTFRCDCDSDHVDDTFKLEPQSYDVIIGSELTYSDLSVDALIATVEKYLTPDGAFYEILSEDRDGVSLFCSKMEARGFATTRRTVPDKYYAKFGTRDWSKQGAEKYGFFTWKRVGSNAPDMED
eukprot:PhM_4_TR13202/c0_g1_i1/m.63632